MGSLIYSAAGTAHRFGAVAKPLDLGKLDPGRLMKVNDPAPAAATAKAEAAMPLGQTLRAQLLETLGLREEDLERMRPVTRSDLEDQIARHVHREVTSGSGARNGLFVDTRA